MKQQLLAAARHLGYHVVRIPERTSSHQTVSPVATYSPWATDGEFQAVYSAIRSHTLVDVYRCWELWQLVKQSAKTPGSVIEVGVWRGGTGALIAHRAGRDPVYLCDTFTGIVKASSRDTLYQGCEHSDTSVAIVQSLLTRTLELQNAAILQGIFPEQTAREIPAATRFRFCHIDVDVYQSARDVLHWVWPRLVVGGMVVFDDYGIAGCEGIAALVNEHADAKDRVVLHNLNGHAIMVKIG